MALGLFTAKVLKEPAFYLLTGPDSRGYTPPPSGQAVGRFAFETLSEASSKKRVKRDPEMSPGPPRVTGSFQKEAGPVSALFIGL
jgi:hypothetical protein